MRRILLILCLLCSVSATGERKIGKAFVDSLVMDLPRQKKDTNRVKMLYDIAIGYRVIDADQGIKYATEGLDLAQQLKWDKGIALSYGAMGVNYTNKCDYPTALDKLLKALTI